MKPQSPVGGLSAPEYKRIAESVGRDQHALCQERAENLKLRKRLESFLEAAIAGNSDGPTPDCSLGDEV